MAGAMPSAIRTPEPEGTKARSAYAEPEQPPAAAATDEAKRSAPRSVRIPNRTHGQRWAI